MDQSSQSLMNTNNMNVDLQSIPKEPHPIETSRISIPSLVASTSTSSSTSSSSTSIPHSSIANVLMTTNSRDSSIAYRPPSPTTFSQPYPPPSIKNIDLLTPIHSKETFIPGTFASSTSNLDMPMNRRSPPLSNMNTQGFHRLTSMNPLKDENNSMTMKRINSMGQGSFPETFGEEKPRGFTRLTSNALEPKSFVGMESIHDPHPSLSTLNSMSGGRNDTSLSTLSYSDSSLSDINSRLENHSILSDINSMENQNIYSRMNPIGNPNTISRVDRLGNPGSLTNMTTLNHNYGLGRESQPRMENRSFTNMNSMNGFGDGSSSTTLNDMGEGSNSCSIRVMNEPMNMNTSSSLGGISNGSTSSLPEVQSPMININFTANININGQEEVRAIPSYSMEVEFMTLYQQVVMLDGKAMLNFLEDRTPEEVERILDYDPSLLERLRGQFIGTSFKNKKKKSGCNEIPRPLNAFMVYRRHMIERLNPYHLKVKYNDMHMDIAKYWHNESKEVKDRYMMKSKIHGIIHSRL